ncbi:MAG: ComF family protein, partial [candidate division WOR-3 bacterium]
ICPTCGHPLGNHKDCKICKSLNPAFDHIRAWALFVPPLDRIIHSFKYERKPSLAHLLGRSMARVAESDPLLKEAQYLIPVPLYKGRQRERGYNQAELLSRVIKEEIKKEVLNCLIRTRNTPTQTRLTEFERKQNVLGAFSLSGGISIQGRSVILIDDVMTTGATLNECARVLKEAGADRVYGLICAVAPV